MRNRLNLGLENKFYIISLSAISILLVVFFTSKLWMYDDEPIMQTPFNREITGLNQTHLKLKSWEYNPEKELMEVVIKMLHKGSDIVKPTYTFKAKERNKSIEYPVKVVYKDDINYVVQIENVPKKYRVVGLFVIEKRDEEMLLSEHKEKLIEQIDVKSDGNETNFKLPDPTQKVLVGDYRKIQTNKNLTTKSVTEYQKDNIELEMQQQVKKVNYIFKEQIPLQERLIISLKEDIKDLKNELEYQTSEEAKETKQAIINKKNQKEKAKNDKESLVKLIEKYQEKHEKLKRKLQSISDDGDRNQPEKEYTETN